MSAEQSDPFTSSDELLAEEALLSFDELDAATCVQIGSHVSAKAQADSLPITVEITLGSRLVYKAAFPGSTEDNDVVIAGKRNVVAISGHSSLYERNRHLENQTTFEEATGQTFPEYAPYGGGVPFRSTDGQQQGVVIVSGLTQEADHAVAVDAIRSVRDATTG